MELHNVRKSEEEARETGADFAYRPIAPVEPPAPIVQALPAPPEAAAAVSDLDEQSHAEAEAREARRVEEGRLEVDRTIKLLMRETRRARRSRRIRIVTAITVITILLLLFIYTRVNLAGNMYWIVQGIAGLWAADKAVSTRTNAARALSNAGDPRAVGVLAMAVRDREPFVRKEARYALQVLLPRVRATDASFIASDQMNALLQIPDRPENDVLILPLLKALGQIGDERAIPVVERLMQSPRDEVRAAASDCLPAVTMRMQRARESATLLRASSGGPSSVAPDQLLRPASGVQADETPPDQLLRPM